MSLRIFFAVLVLALSPARAGAAVPAELLGPWIVSEASRVGLPAECHGMRMEFTSDATLIIVSGAQRFVTKITIEQDRGRFVVHNGDVVESNGMPNCQGRPAEYVMSHLVREVYLDYFERDGAVLRMYVWTRESGRFVDFVRPANRISRINPVATGS